MKALFVALLAGVAAPALAQAPIAGGTGSGGQDPGLVQATGTAPPPAAQPATDAASQPVASPGGGGTDAPSTQPQGTAQAPADTGEIVVTAQRRSENAQKTSLAVTALSGNELVQRGVRDLQDLQNATPALSFADAGLLKFANIRGVGINLQSPTVVSGVATYRDGLFSPSPIFLNEGLFDIASVEVLRGPQGTFVGQNSTGGAIIQKSVSPTLGTTEGNAELSGGNYSFVKFDGGLSLPVTDTLAVRLATQIEHRDSFYNNLGPEGDKPGRVRDEHARLSVLWQPDDHFTALLKVETNFADDGGYPGQPLPGTLYAPFDPPGEFTLDYDRTDTKRVEFSLRTGLELNYKFDNDMTLRSISGYQYGHENFIDDLDGSSSPEYSHHQKIWDNVYSQEINLISPDHGRFKWVLGGTFVRQTAELWLHIDNTRFPFDGTVFPMQDVFIHTTNPKNAYGAFAQGTFRLTDTLSIDLGGRYSRDTQSQSGFLQLSPTPPLPGLIDASSPRYKDSKLTGKAALNWQVTPNHLLYAFVANGFKSGGVNVPAGTFKPEKITDYEGGWKATLFNGTLRTQLDGFYMNYRDLQLDIFDPVSTTTAVTNAGASKIYGFEAQAEVRSGGFSGTANVSYVHSRVGALTLIDTRALPNGTATGLGVQCPAGVASNPPACFDYDPYETNLDGRRNPYSPKWTVSGDARYVFQVGDRRTLTPQVNLSYLSKQSTQLFERPGLDFLDARVLVGAQLTYAWKRWSLTGYVSNLTDDHYHVGNDNANNLTYFGAPRQFGGRLGVRF